MFYVFLYITCFHFTYSIVQKANLCQYIIPNKIDNKYIIPWITYLYSTIHAILSFSSSLGYLLGYVSYEIWYKTIMFTMAYSIYDFGMVWKNKKYFKRYYEILIHHSIMGIGCYYSVYNKYIMAMGLLSESSTIFFNICWFLIHIDLKNSILFKISSLTTVICYFIFRIVNFSYITWFVLKYHSDLYIACYGMPLLLFLNFKWFYLLISKYLNI